MKKLIALIAPLVFVLMTACGGGEEEPPPQALSSAAPPEMRQEMMGAANQMKQTCSGEFGPYAVAIGGGQMPPSPGMPGSGQPIPMGGGSPAFGQPSAPPPSMSPHMAQAGAPAGTNCKNDIMNFLMLYKMYYGAEAGQAGPQQYAMNQFKGVGNAIGKTLVENNIPVTPELVAKLALSAKGVGDQWMGQLQATDLPPEVKSQLSSQLQGAMNFR